MSLKFFTTLAAAALMTSNLTAHEQAAEHLHEDFKPVEYDIPEAPPPFGEKVSATQLVTSPTEAPPPFGEKSADAPTTTSTTEPPAPMGTKDTEETISSKGEKLEDYITDAKADAGMEVDAMPAAMETSLEIKPTLTGTEPLTPPDMDIVAPEGDDMLGN